MELAGGPKARASPDLYPAGCPDELPAFGQIGARAQRPDTGIRPGTTSITRFVSPAWAKTQRSTNRRLKKAREDGEGVLPPAGYSVLQYVREGAN